MPERSSKHPSHRDQVVASGGDAVTGDEPELDGETGTEKNPHAAALGRLGGQKGGPARALKLTAERRREIARKAAEARWHKTDVEQGG